MHIPRSRAAMRPRTARRWNTSASFGTAITSTVSGKGQPFFPTLTERDRPQESRVLWSLAAIVALGVPLLCARSAAARRLLCLLASACAAFVVAKQCAPYLYLPQRHVLYVVLGDGRADSGVRRRVRYAPPRATGALCRARARVARSGCRADRRRRTSRAADRPLHSTVAERPPLFFSRDVAAHCARRRIARTASWTTCHTCRADRCC